MIRKSPAALRAEVVAYAEQHSTSYTVAAAELADAANAGVDRTDAEVRGVEAQYRIVARRIVESAASAGLPLYGADAASYRVA